MIPIYDDDLVFMAFLERAQALHMGVVDMVERGNPIAAISLLRGFSENVAVVYYVNSHPGDMAELRLGARDRLKIGRVVAAAEKNLPGFKRLYDRWSDVAHPSPTGAYFTLDVQDDGTFTWQSHPTFKSTDDARQAFKWLRELRTLARRIVEETAAARTWAFSELGTAEQ